MRFLVLGVIALLAVAGCGGSDGDDDGQTASDTFVQRVDAVCQDTNPELAEIQAALVKARDARRAGRVSQRTTFATFVTLLRQADTTTQRRMVRLRAIAPPEREKAFYDDLIESAEGGATNLRQQVRAAEAQDARRLSELSVQGSVLNARSKGLIAGHGGFRFCGRG